MMNEKFETNLQNELKIFGISFLGATKFEKNEREKMNEILFKKNMISFKNLTLNNCFPICNNSTHHVQSILDHINLLRDHHGHRDSLQLPIYK